MGPPEAVVQERSTKWRARLFARHFDAKTLKELKDLGTTFTPESVTLTTRREGAFAVVVAKIPPDPRTGDFIEATESLIVTKAGDLELKGSPSVEGLADLNGDGRPDLVLGDVTAIADLPTGPLELVVSDKGGAFGWNGVRIGTHEGRAALIATTQTNSTQCIECERGGFGYSATQSKGIIEEVTLVWNGKTLAAVARKPMETAAEAATRARELDAETKRQAAAWAKQKAEMAVRQKQWAAEAEAERKKELAACKKACETSCASDGGAGCLGACQARCAK
jgi:hypothetical protein